MKRIALHGFHLRHRSKVFAALALLVAPVLALIVAACVQRLPAELATPIPEHSIRIEDRRGQLLREVRSPSGTLLQWVPLASIPSELRTLLLATEDRRFNSHCGLDVLALSRATFNNVYRGRVTSGASTLTMQLARALRPHRRNLWGKFVEMALALRIEASLPKTRILEEYLNRVDFGPNLRGIGAASQGYFGKSPNALSLSQSALLVGLLKGPSAYALDRHPERAIARRNRELERAVELHWIARDAMERARAETLQLDQRRSVFAAPHFVSALIQGQLSSLSWGIGGAETKDASRIKVTLDSELQRAAETAVSSIVLTLSKRHVSAAAALVVDNATGDVLAYVGSPNFYDADNQGQVDGVRALRQPGSTLKPFVYAAAFKELGYTAATVLPDLPLSVDTEIGKYSPRNFDDRFRGPVRLREALGNSLNVPAVHVATELGPPTLLRVLHALGFDSLEQKPEYYGPAIALGDGEVTLVELVRAYATLARGGISLPLRAVLEQSIARQTPKGVVNETRPYAVPEGDRVMDVSTATVITDILKDKTARVASFGARSLLEFDFEVAAKTGTSKGFRDNWVVGYCHRYTVGVWAGNFDGSSMQQVSGITGAAPIFHAILAAAMGDKSDVGLPVAIGMYDKKETEYKLGVKRVSICPISGQAVGPDCPHAIFEFVPVAEALPLCQWHQTLTVDRHNGMLAGPSCTGQDVVRKRFEIFPPEYSAWAKSAGHVLPPDEYSPNCPALRAESNDAVAMVRILEPSDGSRFVIDPDRDPSLQALQIAVAAPLATAEIGLEVDGKVIARASRPFVFQWLLQSGPHRFVAVGPRGERSEAVGIEVRDSR